MSLDPAFWHETAREIGEEQAAKLLYLRPDATDQQAAEWLEHLREAVRVTFSEFRDSSQIEDDLATMAVAFMSQFEALRKAKLDPPP